MIGTLIKMLGMLIVGVSVISIDHIHWALFLIAWVCGWIIYDISGCINSKKGEKNG